MDVEAYDEVQIVVRFTGGQATEPSTTEPCLNHCAPENLSRWCKQPIRIGLSRPHGSSSKPRSRMGLQNPFHRQGHIVVLL